MADSHRLELVRDCYRAYVSGERDLLEKFLSDDFVFYSPVDVGINRTRYFERCWPNAGLFAEFELKRLVEAGDEVIVTYEATRTDGRRFCNTEVFTFARDKVVRVEVYFGWDVDERG